MSPAAWELLPCSRLPCWVLTRLLLWLCARVRDLLYVSVFVRPDSWHTWAQGCYLTYQGTGVLPDVPGHRSVTWRTPGQMSVTWHSWTEECSLTHLAKGNVTWRIPGHKSVTWHTSVAWHAWTEECYQDCHLFADLTHYNMPLSCTTQWATQCGLFTSPTTPPFVHLRLSEK